MKNQYVQQLCCKDSIDAIPFIDLYRKYLPALVRYIKRQSDNRSCPEELVQEVFTRYLQNKGQFQYKSSIKTYLFGFAKKVLQEESKRLYRQNAIHLGTPKYAVDVAIIEDSPEILATRVETTKIVHQAILKLTNQQKKAVLQFHLEGKSMEETALTFNCSIQALDGNLRRARKRLAKLLPVEG